MKKQDSVVLGLIKFFMLINYLKLWFVCFCFMSNPLGGIGGFFLGLGLIKFFHCQKKKFGSNWPIH